MSRIGKNPVNIPSGVTCQIQGRDITVKGKNGELTAVISREVEVVHEGEQILVKPLNDSKEARQLWGTWKKRIENMVIGVNDGFTKELEIKGVGYRASMAGSSLKLQLGYSHDILYPIPEGIKVNCPTPTEVVISGHDAQKVGQIAAEIRAFRKPEPYKGKGVKYKDEYIVRKEGKKK